MLKNKLLYLLLLAGSVMFWLFYTGYLSFLLFLLVLLLPLALLAVTVPARIMLNEGVDVPHAAVTRGDEIEIVFWVENRSFLPLSRVRFAVTYQNLFVPGSQPYKESVYLTAAGRQTVRVVRKIRSENCGTLCVSVPKVYVCDYFGIFSLGKKAEQTVEVTVLPSIVPLEDETPTGLYTEGESDTFSAVKPGDDPSEVFDIRDYRDGDRIQRIHWKLTLKQGHFMVREFSLPCQYSPLLVFDLCSGENVDALLTALVSVSYFFISHKLTHRIAWYDHKNEEFYGKKVSELEDLFSIIGSILELASYSQASAPLELLAALTRNKKYSRVLYFRPGDFTAEEYGDEVQNIANLIMICAVDAGQTEQMKKTQDRFSALSVPLILVTEENLRECLKPSAFV